MQPVIAILLFLIVLGLLPVILPILLTWLAFSPESLAVVLIVLVGAGIASKLEEKGK